MKRLKNILFPAIGFAILVGALVLSGLQPQEVESQSIKDVIVANTPLPIMGNVGITGTPNVNVTNAVQVDDTTPIMVDTGDRQLPSQIVSLTLAGSSTDCADGTRSFFVVNKNGTQIVGAFKAPDGSVLVVTSVQYQIGSADPDTLVQVALRKGSLNSGLFSGSIANANGFAVGSETFPTGIVFGPGTAPCIQIFSGSGGFLTASIQGYIAPDN